MKSPSLPGKENVPDNNWIVVPSEGNTIENSNSRALREFEVRTRYLVSENSLSNFPRNL